MFTFPFDTAFQTLTDHSPFPWQRRLYESFVQGDFPESVALPTGMGKTSVLALWLLALAREPKRVPRRLVYVVNRRTVVDQSSAEARQLAERLAAVPGLVESLVALAAVPHEHPLAISPLRGQLADNRAWRVDPARPAILVGTVDMIGSRLLFAGYGCGYKSQPLHAGFLGQDALLIHDEAHLEPAFQQLLEAIQAEQTSRDFRPLRVMQLTATSRSRNQTFCLNAEDEQHSVIHKRYHAIKKLTFVPIRAKDELVPRLAELAVAQRESGDAILVFARSLRDVEELAKVLTKQKLGGQMLTLTGVMRGHERDALVNKPIFRRFLLPAEHEPEPRAQGTCYLLCTSAGEVGVNLSADRLLCDLTTFESMAQRFGRVNRFGHRDATIHLVHEPLDPADDLDTRRQRTLELLQRLPDGNASPAALAQLPFEERLTAFTAEPFILPTDAILFDGWAATTVRAECPQRPEVADWLHGLSPREEPQTRVVWRKELDQKNLQAPPEELLELYPIRPHEVLQATTGQVVKEMKKLAARYPKANESPVGWIVSARDQVESIVLSELPQADLAGRMVILPESVGGMTPEGTLDGSSDYALDVADLWCDEQGNPLRYRTRDETDQRAGYRLIKQFVLEAEESDTEDHSDSEEPPPVWLWYVRPRQAEDASGSWFATQEQELNLHLELAAEYAECLARKLDLPAMIHKAVVFAARHHDRGKVRAVWQRSIGNRDPQRILAKSQKGGRPEQYSKYRHEFGSLMDVANEMDPTDEAYDLALHLIAAHHGRARPHFPEGETFDPEGAEQRAREIAAETPRRFDRLQRQYGRWGLAYLESLLRAVDALASEERKV
jgi:CRISPR-associated endonuclease/helicase Cas3